jgi:hypothetical protein
MLRLARARQPATRTAGSRGTRAAPKFGIPAPYIVAMPYALGGALDDWNFVVNIAVAVGTIGASTMDQLNYEIAQLELIAGQRLRESARALHPPHETLQHWLRPASGADPSAQTENVQLTKLAVLERQVINAARADIGVDSRRTLRRWRPLRRRAQPHDG